MAVNPKIKQLAEYIRSKRKARDVRESISSGLESMSEDVVENESRQLKVEQQFQVVLDETTGKDVISAPELLAARIGVDGTVYPNAKARIDAEQNETNRQLAHKVSYDFPTNTIFKKGDFGSQYFRIPYGITTNKGTIVAGSDVRYYGDDDFGRHDTGVARSEDGGENWIDKQIILRNNGVNSTFSRVMDSMIVYDKINDAVFVFGVKLDDSELWYQADNNNLWDVVYTKSTTDGKTWSEEVSIKNVINAFPDRNRFLTGVGSGIQMTNGTLVLPIQYSKGGAIYSGIVYSKDFGNNWEMSSGALSDVSSECNVVETVPGELLLNARAFQNNGNKRVLYQTNDLGKTWTSLESNYVASPNKLYQSTDCQGSMITAKLPSGDEKILFAVPYNTKGDRSNLTLFKTESKGEKWDVIGTINAEKGEGYIGYNNLVSADGKLFDVIEWNGDILIKNITTLLPTVAKKEVIQQSASYSTYNIYVNGTVGNDNAVGTNTSQLKTLSEALKRVNTITKYGAKNRVVINIETNLNENIIIREVNNLEYLEIKGINTKKEIGYILVNYCDTLIKLTNINFKGAFDSSIGSRFHQVRRIEVIGCTFDSNATSALTVDYTKVYLESPIFVKNIDSVNGIDVKGMSDAEINNMSLTGGTFTHAIQTNHSKLNVYTNANPSKMINNTDSLVASSIKAIRSLSYNDLKLNIELPTMAYPTGFTENGPNKLRLVLKGENVSVKGFVQKSTGSFAKDTVIYKLNPSYLPVSKTYISAYGWGAESFTKVVVEINTNGDVILKETVSDATVQSLGLYFDYEALLG